MSSTVSARHKSRRAVFVALLALLLVGWIGYSLLTKAAISSSGDVVAVIQGREFGLPFTGGGGSARTVTITVSERGCLGFDGTAAAWPHGVVVNTVAGDPRVEYAGHTYAPGDQIDINALAKPIASTSLESWGFQVPSACGRTLAVISPGFSAAR